MKRLDIKLTTFIKLHVLLLRSVIMMLSVRVYTQNFLSLNGMSWCKFNYYTGDRSFSYSSFGASYFRIMVVFSLAILTLFCSVIQTERQAMLETNFTCLLKENHFWYPVLRSLITHKATLRPHATLRPSQFSVKGTLRWYHKGVAWPFWQVRTRVHAVLKTSYKKTFLLFFNT